MKCDKCIKLLTIDRKTGNYPIVMHFQIIFLFLMKIKYIHNIYSLTKYQKLLLLSSHRCSIWIIYSYVILINNHIDIKIFYYGGDKKGISCTLFIIMTTLWNFWKIYVCKINMKKNYAWSIQFTYLFLYFDYFTVFFIDFCLCWPVE